MSTDSEARLLQPDKQAFAADPFGYSALAWQKWAIGQNVAGFALDPLRPPRSEDLKSPILWLSQAHALSEAAALVLRGEPNLNHMPTLTKSVCHSQYCAVGLMLVGYSLEICLKAMLIITIGVEKYRAEESKHKHHDLVRLSEFVSGLSAKETAILQLLSQFVRWAGRSRLRPRGRCGADIFSVRGVPDLCARPFRPHSAHHASRSNCKHITCRKAKLASLDHESIVSAPEDQLTVSLRRLMRRLRKVRSYVHFPRDVVLTIVSTLLGTLIGLGISELYYRKSLSDLKGDADERKKLNELILRGIESAGTIRYHRDPTGNVVGVSIDLHGTAAANVTAVGTLSDAKPEQN